MVTMIVLTLSTFGSLDVTFNNARVNSSVVEIADEQKMIALG